MVTLEGVVKVLDFGLAKLALRSDSGRLDIDEAPTVDARDLSRAGTVAGTLGYMSPEQASGGSVDSRSDVFSFGAVLYEMVTGRRAFGGRSGAEMLAAVLKDQPKPPSELAIDVPRELERVILRRLRKDVDRRFQSMLDVKVELQEAKEESDSLPAATAGVTRRPGRRWLVLAVAGAVLAISVGLTAWRVRRADLPLPRVVALTTSRHAGAGSLSPDGTQVAFESQTQDAGWDVWLKMVGETEARRLTTNPADDFSPTRSPDGRRTRLRSILPGQPPTSIWLISSVAGPERKLASFPVRDQLSWVPRRAMDRSGPSAPDRGGPTRVGGHSPAHHGGRCPPRGHPADAAGL